MPKPADSDPNQQDSFAPREPKAEPFPRWDPLRFELPQRGRRFVTLDNARTNTAATAASGEPTPCPCCAQRVAVYERRIYAQMAACLLWIVCEYSRTGGEWVTLRDGPIFRGGDNAKLAYWKLTERMSSDSDATGGRAGQWRPTSLGVEFARRLTRVPRIAYVYDGHVVGFSEDSVSIEDCLAKRFDYNELLSRFQGTP